MNKSFGLVTFILGAAAGSAATWYLVKKKYEKIAQEEIDSVKEKFASRPVYHGPQDSDEVKAMKKAVAQVIGEKPSIAEYAKRLSTEGYTSYSDSEITSEKKEEPVKETEPIKVDKPYVITPDEFGEFDDYDKISLMYYADGVLADDADDIVEDVEDVVVPDFADHFGEYDDDSVYVRNDRLKVDYEILRSLKTYSDVIKSKPYLMED